MRRVESIPIHLKRKQHQLGNTAISQLSDAYRTYPETSGCSLGVDYLATPPCGPMLHQTGGDALCCWWRIRLCTWAMQLLNALAVDGGDVVKVLFDVVYDARFERRAVRVYRRHVRYELKYICISGTCKYMHRYIFLATHKQLVRANEPVSPYANKSMCNDRSYRHSGLTVQALYGAAHLPFSHAGANIQRKSIELLQLKPDLLDEANKTKQD